jgi:hypothetical protein
MDAGYRRHDNEGPTPRDVMTVYTAARASLPRRLPRHFSPAGVLAVAIALLPQMVAALSPEEARAQLDTELSRCTQRFSFDPTATGLPERALASGERSWRECAYEGIRKHLVPNSTIPDVYLQLIGEDRTLTDRLDRGEITRAERRQRLGQLIDRIRNAEREKIRAEQQQLTDYMDQQLEEVLQVHHRLDPF